MCSMCFMCYGTKSAGVYHLACTGPSAWAFAILQPTVPDPCAAAAAAATAKLTYMLQLTAESC